MLGYYHSVETFGTVDGRGIRYVLFLAGCNLGCTFCHNPDTWARGDKTISVEEVLADIAKYRNYYDASGGGITVSGGEPLLQAEFVTELFKACQAQGIHTTLDTSGHSFLESIKKVLPYTDAVLFCLKAADTAKHLELTGKYNADIIKNLQYISGKVPFTIRYVVIPGINNSSEDIQTLAALVKSLPEPASVEVLAYHTLGKNKWEQLGWEYKLDGVPEAAPQDITTAAEMLKGLGVEVCA